MPGRVIRKAWLLVRPLVARSARSLRPFMRWMLRVPGVRPVARLLLAPHTRLGRRVRTFLVAAAPVDAGAAASMTEEAIMVEARLRAAIRRQLRA